MTRAAEGGSGVTQAALPRRPSQPTRTRSAYDVDVSDEPITIDGQQAHAQNYSDLACQLRLELSGEVFVRGHSARKADEITDDDAGSSEFKKSTTLFNSAAPLAAWIVVRPTCAEDVVATIKFCAAHTLSPSIRSGGYSTAGWSIQGDVVIDMRSMNRISMLPPAARYARQYNVPSPVAMSSRRDRGSGSDADQESNGSSSGDSGNGAAKRRRGNAQQLDRSSGMMFSDGQHQYHDDNGTLAQSGDSGADADGEASSGGKEGSVGSEPVSDDASQEDQSLPQLPSQLTALSVSEIHGPDHTTGSHNSGSQSHGSGTGSSADAGGTATTATSTDVDMADSKTVLDQSSGQVSSPIDTQIRNGTGAFTPAGVSASPFEHERWKRHHRPATDSNDVLSTGNGNRPSISPPDSASRLVLPATGGFVWTADNGETGSTGTTRPLNSGDPIYLGGATLPDLRAAQASSADGSSGDFLQERLSPHSGRTHASRKTEPHHCHDEWDKSFNASGGDAQSTYGKQGVTSSAQDSFIKPGIHADKYRLVEFEPGVGVRDLDVYTDRLGRSNFAPAETPRGRYSGIEKGKARFDLPKVDDVRWDESSLSFTNTSNGVPYHVPLSAYPVGSTATTIGGFGYLSRAYGLSLDNIVELDIVLADGRFKTLNCLSSASSDPEEVDLWWAARGAAPCFGIVTRIVAKAYPVPRVYAGNLIYPFNPATAPSLLRHWRDCLKGTGGSIPRELYSNLILTSGPPDEEGEHVIVIQVCYLGTSSSEEIGHSFVQAINSWTGERVLLKDVSEKSMLTQQDGVAQVLKSGQGRRWMVRGDLLTTLTDEVISRSVQQFCTMANRAVWLFELVGGAIEDGADGNGTCVGKAQRQAKFIAGALQQWVDRDEDTACVRGVETWVNDVLTPVSVGGPFAAFLERGESRARCEGAFGKENFARLLDIKRRVDPNGVYRHTFGRGLVEFAK